MSGKINDRTGETSIASNGMKMTIIAYRRSDDIDIQFEDGVIIKNKQYSGFKRGAISHPTIKSKAKQPHTWHIGEKNTSRSGRPMTIIGWRRKRDIDIQFDDKTIVYHKSYFNFKKGAVAHPDDGKFGEKWKYKNHLGETITKPNGDTMTITAYNSAHDFDVTFPDGTVVHCIRYKDFQNGYIRNPNAFRNKHVGEEVIANNGLHAKIIDCEGWNSVKVQFEDGVEITTNYKRFKEGVLKHPNISVRIQQGRNKYVGKTFIANNGMQFKVIDYKNSDNLTIKFEDGTQVTTTVGGICSKHIENPNYNIKTMRIGETNTASIGMKMSISKYKTSTNIDIQFEDGYIATNKTYTCFKRGTITHDFPYAIGNIVMNGHAYTHDNIGNFYCKCNKCGMKDIMCLEEIKKHKCHP